MISIVIPAYDEGYLLYKLFDRLSIILDQTKKTFEIILINDGSEDNSFEVMQSINKKDKKYIFRLCNELIVLFGHITNIHQ